MAVRPDVQRHGHGTRLVKAVLEAAREADATVVWADARLSAVTFYVRLGASAEGATYVDDVTGLQDQRVVFDLPPER
jgi:predicted N-acetyltransferase YhbS